MCVSASGGSAAVIGVDGVRGQRAGAVERGQRCTDIPSGLGTIYRSE